MKFELAICALIVVPFYNASGQVSSHAQPAAYAPAATQMSRPVGKPVARVNGVVLTDADLVREEYAIFPYAKQHDGAIPTEMEPGIRKGALQMIIFEELVYQDATKRRVTVSPERLNRAQAEFRNQFETPAAYRHFLQSEFKGSEAALRNRIQRSLIIEQLLKQEVEAKAALSPAELRAYYDRNPQRFQYPESFAMQTISIIPPDNASATQLADAKRRAEEAYKQAKTSKTAEAFGLLAEKLSDDDYRVMMGDHKWVARDKVPPEMLQPALKMKDGQTSELIQVGHNWVIFRMNHHLPAGRIPFERVKVQLREELQKHKTNQVRAAFDKRLHQNAKIETL